MVLFITSFLSCISNPGFSDTPEISFIGLSKDTLTQNNLFADSLFITINFRDGDGDLGTDDNTIEENIIMTDSRTGEVFSRFKFPEFPTTGNQSGIEGTITLKVFTTCCIFPDGIPPCESPSQFPTDEFQLDIYMKDDAGNQSNLIQTNNIILLCN